MPNAIAIPGSPIPAGTQVSPGGSQGAAGHAGQLGPQGDSIQIKGTVNAQSDLPASGNTPGDVYITADGNGWVRNSANTGWNNIGRLRGPEGPIGLRGLKGDKGEVGENAYSNTASAFTVPAPGDAITVTLTQADWITVGQMIFVEDAGEDTAGVFQCIGRNGDDITLLNPPEETAFSLGELLAHVATSMVPPGAIIDFAGPAAPIGFLLCDGTQHATASYPKLFAAIGYTYGGSGAVFNVPDCRSRMTVCAGQGAGLSDRVLAAQGGVETVTLTEAQMPWHWHTVDSHQHVVDSHQHSVDIDHYHNINTGGHGHGDPSHAHLQGTYGGYVPGAYGFYSSVGNQVATSYSGAGLYNAGDLGGSTLWVHQMSGNWQHRGTDWRAPATDWRAPNTNAKGSGHAHTNMPPFIVCWKIIKL